MANLKDNVTNWMALLVLVAQGVYMIVENWANGEPFNWKQLIVAVLGAFILWVTGKAANLKKKNENQVEWQKKAANEPPPIE